MEKFLSLLAYLWRIAMNLIMLAIVVGILSRVHDRFETIVVAILGLLYVTIRTIAFGQALMFTQLAIGIDSDFSRIRRLLGDESVDEHQKEVTELKANFDRRMGRAYVDIFFLAIISLICLYQLISQS